MKAHYDDRCQLGLRNDTFPTSGGKIDVEVDQTKLVRRFLIGRCLLSILLPVNGNSALPPLYQRKQNLQISLLVTAISSVR